MSIDNNQITRILERSPSNADRISGPNDARLFDDIITRSFGLEKREIIISNPY